MRKHVLAFTISIAALSGAAAPALAQGDRDNGVIFQPGQLLSTGSQTSEITGQGGMRGNSERREMMGAMMRGGMTGRAGMMGGAMMRPGDRAEHAMLMRIIFALMDGDGDGAISLPEFQGAHERLFKAMDSNKDGRLSMEEMQNFMHGATSAAPGGGGAH